MKFLKINRNWRNIFLSTTFIAFSSCLFGQHLVKGKVVDSEGKPAFAVNVFLSRNISIGTISNMDGLFELLLDNIHTSDTIIFSNISYITKKIPAN